MQVTLTKELEKLVEEKVHSGRYADVSDVVRDALRVLEQRDDFESPALEAAVLEGVRSPHRPYGKDTLERIRRAARSAIGEPTNPECPSIVQSEVPVRK